MSGDGLTITKAQAAALAVLKAAGSDGADLSNVTTTGTDASGAIVHAGVANRLDILGLAEHGRVDVRGPHRWRAYITAAGLTALAAFEEGRSDG